MQYEIKTIADLMAAINADNVDGFLRDFETWLRLQIELKEKLARVQETMPEGVRVTTTTDRLIWNDDGNYGKVNAVTFEVKS